MTRMKPKINRMFRVVTTKWKVENVACFLYGSQGERKAIHSYIYLLITHSFNIRKHYYVQSTVPGARDTAINESDKSLLLWNLQTIVRRGRCLTRNHNNV